IAGLTVNPGAVNSLSNTVSFTTAATVPTTNPYTVSSTVSSPTADPIPGDNTDEQQTSVRPAGPVAADIVNNGRAASNAGQAPLGNTAGPVNITSLTAAPNGTGNTIVAYTLLSLPAVGTLYVNNLVVNATTFPGLVLTPVQAAQLSYDPAAVGAQGTTAPSTLDAGNQS
ncbi:hypothetical protein, partial [Hymenobacter terrenus]|uniref:hypothetical protein n=1 Tax=Hymenobacter terrenus TaxID=1629124 RepID=UPI000619A400